LVENRKTTLKEYIQEKYNYKSVDNKK